MLPPKDVTPSNFVEKTFKNSHKTSKFMKVFSLITGYRPFHHPKDNSRQIFQAIQQVTDEKANYDFVKELGTVGLGNCIRAFKCWAGIPRTKI